MFNYITALLASHITMTNTVQCAYAKLHIFYLSNILH